MALTVVTDPFSSSANSYVSVAEADDYVATRSSDASLAAAWAALSADNKAKYLVNATRSLDMMAEWIGDRYSRDQKLDWPRVNAYVDGFLLDQITFPDRVQEATIEMALWSLQNSGAVGVSQSAAFDSIRVGPISIDFNEGAGLAPNKYFPEVVAYLLSEYGALTDPNMPGANRIKVARLIRS